MNSQNDIANLQALMGADAASWMQQGGDTQAWYQNLQKTLTAATGFVGYNLEDQAKLMLPLFAGLRNRLPVDRPAIGAAAATWRMQLGYGAFNFGTNLGTANGANGGATTPANTSISADYKSQSVTGNVEWEAIQQARGFDDALAIETSIALSTLLRMEELVVLGGNETALTMSTVTVAASTLSDANTFGAGVWSVFVTAITEQGALTNASGNSNTGESAKSVRADVTVGGGSCDFLDVSWPVVPGAVGYKIYCNTTVGGGNTVYLCDPATTLKYAKYTAGAIDLTAFGDAIVVPSGQTFVGVNRVQIYAAPANTQPVPPSGDGSANANTFEGLFAWCEKNTIYGQALPQNHLYKDMGGAPLTTAGTGITEFDYILQNLWQTWHTSPSLIITSPNGVTSLGNKLVAANNGSMFRLDITNERNKITGGLYIGGYTNKFASSMAGMQTSVDVWAHPYCPDGSFLFVSERIPYQYSREGRGFALDVQTPYTYLELGRTARSFPFDVFFGETLKCYHPSAQAWIGGCRVDA